MDPVSFAIRMTPKRRVELEGDISLVPSIIISGTFSGYKIRTPTFMFFMRDKIVQRKEIGRFVSHKSIP